MPPIYANVLCCQQVFSWYVSGMEGRMDAKTQPIAAEFDLREEIRTAINKGATDPYKIAKRLGRMVPAEMVMSFVELYIVDTCQSMMSKNRRGSFVQEVDEPTAPGVALNEDRWRNGVVHVPGNGYVRYSDLTASDCVAIAADRETTATGYVEEARRFRALAAAMNAHKVETAGALPESVRAEILK
jgi:hypothetical protein